MVLDENKPVNKNEKNEHGLTEQQQKVVEMLIFDGKTQLLIAEELGLHRNTVNKWLKKPEVIAERSRCEQELARQTKAQMNAFVVAHGMDIVQKLYELSQSTDKRVSAQCSQYLVDRILGKATAKLEVDTDNSNADMVPSADAILERIKGRKLEVYNAGSSAKSA